jgi:hypothetical protein
MRVKTKTATSCLLLTSYEHRKVVVKADGALLITKVTAKRWETVDASGVLSIVSEYHVVNDEQESTLLVLSYLWTELSLHRKPS